MNVMVFTLVLWSWHVHDISDPRAAALRGVLRHACLLFSVPVLILLGGPLCESSVAALRQRSLTTDSLLLLGVAAAFVYSTASLFLGGSEVYFEVCCMILVAVTLGKWLEGTAKWKATSAIRSLQTILPGTARVSRDGELCEVPLDEVRVGDLVNVAPGERVPVDGEVTGSRCFVDEQIITGESVPVLKEAGDTAFGGSLNLSQSLHLEATSSAQEGMISRLVEAVEKATSARDCRVVRLADRLAAWFVPIIAVLACVAFVYHGGSSLQTGLMAALAVVLISCPCALGIATPLALWVAMNVAARRGVLFRNGDVLSKLARIRTLGIDKTGTLTRGDLDVVDEAHTPEVRDAEVWGVTLQLAKASRHPIARALSQVLLSRGLRARGAPPECAVRELPGKGVLAEGGTDRAFLGSPALADELGFRWADGLPRTSPADGASYVCVGWGEQVQGWFALADALRPESADVLHALQQLGVQPVILSGDTPERAQAIQQRTGVPAQGGLLPDDKASVLLQMPGPVGMVGDGFNDAASLARADVGIALAAGADLSRDASGVCLLGSSLRALPFAVELARATRRTIRRNLLWAVSYNLVGVGIALSGNLNPIVAAIAMVGSSLFVLTSSLTFAMAYSESPQTPEREDVEASQESVPSMPRLAGNAPPLEVVS